MPENVCCWTARRFSKQRTRLGSPSLLIRSERCLHPIARYALDPGITAKTIEPCHFWFATKPGHLSFCVIAVGLLRGLECLLAREASVQELNRLSVAESSQRAGAVAIFLQQALGLLDQPMFEHVLRPLIDALIKRIPIGLETDTQNAKAAQGVATLLLPQLRYLPARGQANFNGTDQLGRVMGMYLCRSSTVQMVQEAVQVVGASAGVMFPQTLAQSLRALRAGKESFQ